MDFFHFATANARLEFERRHPETDDERRQRLADRDATFQRAIRKCETPGMQNPLHGWGEDTGK